MVFDKSLLVENIHCKSLSFTGQLLLSNTGLFVRTDLYEIEELVKSQEFILDELLIKKKYFFYNNWINIIAN